MLIYAKTHHGQYLEKVSFQASDVEEFIAKAGEHVGYVRPGMDNLALVEAWGKLVKGFYADFGWTDFFNVEKALERVDRFASVG